MSLFTTLIPSFTRTPVRHGASPADPGPTVKPHYDVNETGTAFGVTVHLPGVTRDGLELTAEEGQFRIVGRRAWKQPEGWTALYRESVDAPYELVLTHDNAIDADQIHAEIRDGVLRIALPKAEAIKPRKITVN
ncbi:MAG: Hsp20/alpha crystallin family protein [Verrucomicrobia bacterium]|nr:Hsp20/alpha crystallin family protein [Verrucomicrobiota bacterium]